MVYSWRHLKSLQCTRVIDGINVNVKKDHWESALLRNLRNQDKVIYWWTFSSPTTFTCLTLWSLLRPLCAWHVTLFYFLWPKNYDIEFWIFTLSQRDLFKNFWESFCCILLPNFSPSPKFNTIVAVNIFVVWKSYLYGHVCA